MYQVGDEEKKNIARGFLKTAPPGEFIEVFTDVRKLLKNDTLLNSIAPTSFKEYNTEQYLIARNDSGFKGLVSNFGEVGNNQYLDPHTKQVFTFDHLKQQVTEVSGGGEQHLNHDVEQWRSNFQTHALKYVDDYFQDTGCCAVYGAKNGGQHVINFVVTSARFNPDNFWNGRWRSTWVISFTPGGQATLSGTIQLNVHYYEEGNVQLVSNTVKNHNVSAQNPEQFGKDAVAAIQKIEGDFHNSLDANYDAMSSTTFKALRRPLPIFKQLIKWENLAQYEQGSQLKNN
jgi:capping protein alpha